MIEGEVRVLYASDTVLPSRAANTVQSLRTAEALGARGHEVTFFCRRLRARPDEIAALYGLEVPVRVVGTAHLRWPFRSWQYAAVIALTARVGRWDVLLTRSERAAWMAVLLGARVVLELHAPLESRRLRSSIAKGAGPALVAITEALRESVRSQVGADVPVFVVHDGASSSEGARRGSGPRSDAGRVKVGYVGHLYPGKGMEIIAEVARRCPTTDVVVVGGEDRDIDHWRIELADVANLVLLGHHPHRDIPDILAGVDVGLLPNQEVVHDAGGRDIGRWTSPLKAFEYMAAGLAIIASDLENLREILEDDVNALLCPAEDVEAWVRALDRLATDPHLRARLGTRAREDLVREFAWERRADRLTEIMLQVTGHADR